MKKGEKLAKVGEYVYVHDKRSAFFGSIGEVTAVFWPKEQEYHVNWIAGPMSTGPNKEGWCWCNEAQRIQEFHFEQKAQ